MSSTNNISSYHVANMTYFNWKFDLMPKPQLERECWITLSGKDIDALT